MYFSKNSRCVLQRVRFLSPTFLTSNQNLCIKKPKDDPSKPPLRINIPKDPAQSDGLPTFLKNSLAEHDSRLKESKSCCRQPNFDHNFLYKSKSEIQFSQFGVDDVSMKNNEMKKAAPVSSQTRSQTDEDYNEEAKEMAAFAEIPADRGDRQSEMKNVEVSFGNELEDSSSSRSLYIIIDVPKKADEKYSSKETAHAGTTEETAEEEADLKLQMSAEGTNRPKPDAVSSRKGSSLSKSHKSQTKMIRNFEVHEIEDEGTHVFHLKFNPNPKRKSCGVGWVPEKEITTRNQDFGYSDSPIKMKKFPTLRLNRSGRESSIVHEHSKTLKYPEGKKKQRNQESHPETDKKSAAETPRPEEEVEAILDTVASESSGAKTVSDAKEKIKISPRFERDDFGLVRAGNKSHSLETFAKTNEAKPEESVPRESLSPATAVNEEEVLEKALEEASKDSAVAVAVAPAAAEVPKVEKKETFESLKDISINLGDNNKGYYPEASRQNKNQDGRATDSYALYLRTHEREQSTTENPSPEPPKNSQTSEYLSIHDKELIQSPPMFESTHTKNWANEAISVIKTQEDHQLDDEPEYMSIYEKRKTARSRTSVELNRNSSDTRVGKYNSKTQGPKKQSKKKFSENSEEEMLEAENPISSRLDKNEATDFRTSPSTVNIGCDKTTKSPPDTFGAAFPPFLSEILKSRFKFKKDFWLSTKWTKTETGQQDKNSDFSQRYSATEFSKNSILFPKKESENFDCDSLFSTQEEIIFNIIKNKKPNTPKVTDNVANVSSDDMTSCQVKSSIDSLSVMKKVKEIIQFDLDNAVKIFKNGEGDSSKELPSVVILKGDSWEVDNEELGKQMEIRKREMKNIKCADIPMDWGFDLGQEGSANRKNDILGDKAETKVPKYLPSKEGNPSEIKLYNGDLYSVITYNSKTKTFFINEEALEEAKNRRTEEFLKQIVQNIDILVKSSENPLEVKTGDSILVFDEESQSWRVDFSILEKREQQVLMEKQLTDRSELILETFEKFEKGQLPTVPKPDSKNKKTFDYKTEKWKAYDKETKSTKLKSPFKESDAEEIRRKNSDLYENLFVANKKETKMRKAEKVEKVAPGLDSTKTNKETKSQSTGKEKKAADSSDRVKGSGSTPRNPDAPKPQQSILPTVNQEKPKTTEDDFFWESFLKMNILPRDFKEISNTIPSTKPSNPKLPPPSKIPPKIEKPKIEGPKMPEKKVEVPKIEGPKMPEKKVEVPKIEEPKMPEKKVEVPKIEEPKMPEKKVEVPIPKTPEKKIEDSRFKIELPFLKSKIVDLSIKMIKPIPAGKDKKKEEKKPPPSAGAGPEKKEKPEKKAPPPSSSAFPSGTKSSTTTSSKQPPKQPPKPTLPTPPSPSPSGKIQDSKGKNEKIASAADHYVSDKIIEISKNKTKDNQSKTVMNKMETVKLNIVADKRSPSKITEINLGKKREEKAKEPSEAQANPPVTPKKPEQAASAESKKSAEDKKALLKNLEKYKTHFSDPEYEENSAKIKSDIESNPNLNKLENFNKTLVLHDIMKPSDAIDSWLKDETDKMATLLLKILQDAANGKPKRKQSTTKARTGDKNLVNLSLEEDKKSKQGEGVKVLIKSEKLKDIPIQSGKSAKPLEVIDTTSHGKNPSVSATGTKGVQLPEHLDAAKSKMTETALEAVMDPALLIKDSKFPLEISEDIPGPEILKKISNTWKALRILGSQMTIFTMLRSFRLANFGNSIFGKPNANTHKRFPFTKMFTKYGPIVNVQGPLSGNVILIHKPEHLTAVFDQDVSLLIRSVFDSVEKARRDTEEKALVIDTSTDWSKPEWNELKRGTEDVLFRGGEKYFRTAEMTANSLVSNVRKTRNAQDLVSENFMEEIKRWSLEGLCNVLFEKSFGFLEGRTTNMTWIMEPEKLYRALDQVTRCLNNCEGGFQAWRLIPTLSFSALGHAYRTISSIFQKQLYQTEMNLKNKNELLREGISFPMRELTFTESMLLNDGMTIEEITCNLVDIMLIGTNMMNSAMGFLLYNLAQYPKIQQKLAKELQKALPHKNSPLDYHKLQSLKYLQACLNESLRLHMPIPVFFKMLQNDILLANYIVPKGTYVYMDYRVSCMKKQIFDDPEKYVPERWLNDENWIHEIHPFNSFPFCHGPRGELAKKIVETQLLVCIAKMIRNFQIEYHYGEVQETNGVINFPDKPLKFNFVERES